MFRLGYGKMRYLVAADAGARMILPRSVIGLILMLRDAAVPAVLFRHVRTRVLDCLSVGTRMEAQ